MRRVALCAAALAAAAALVSAQPRRGKTLDIYAIDVEGGNSMLFVSPSGESLLIDAGNAGATASVRDASRIIAAATDAGVSQIDHFIITHWHTDHAGGVAELASRIPIRQYIDHGPTTQPGQGLDQFLQNIYPGLYGKAVHTIAKPGDRIPMAGLDVRIVASNGEVLKTPMPGARKPNPRCASFKLVEGNDEDLHSIGTYITFGKFRAVHLADLPTQREFELMCPSTKLDTVDVMLGMHHGQDTSNSEVAVHALRPRVAIMNDGTRKGGNPSVMKTIFSSPGLEDLWQMHFSQLSGQEYTVPGMFIANGIDAQPDAMPIEPMPPPQPGGGAGPSPVHNGPAFWIKLSAQDDGTFTVTNARNGFSKTYRR